MTKEIKTPYKSGEGLKIYEELLNSLNNSYVSNKVYLYNGNKLAKDLYFYINNKNYIHFYKVERCSFMSEKYFNIVDIIITSDGKLKEHHTAKSMLKSADEVMETLNSWVNE